MSDRNRKAGTRDGLFQKSGWWWIDYYDGAGRRHRKKAAPDYQTAKMIYRNMMTAIAKGEVLGVREEGIRLREFVDKRYWPSVVSTLAPAWAERSRGILDALLEVFGDRKLSGLRQEEIERWSAGRRGQVKASTANKELARLKHVLGRAIAWGYLKASPAAKVGKAKELCHRLLGRPASESGTLCHVEGADGRSGRRRRVRMLPTLHVVRGVAHEEPGDALHHRPRPCTTAKRRPPRRTTFGQAAGRAATRGSTERSVKDYAVSA